MRVASGYRLKVEPIDFPEWEEVSFRGKSRYEFGMTLSLMGGWSKDHWLSVTVGTLTIAMNSLVKKGYVFRERGKEDRRVVYISLTDRGKAAYEHHERFHRAMIDSISRDLSEEEMEMLVKTLAKLEQWFRGRQDN